MSYLPFFSIPLFGDIGDVVIRSLQTTGLNILCSLTTTLNKMAACGYKPHMIIAAESEDYGQRVLI